jgi:hypothetical protein
MVTEIQESDIGAMNRACRLMARAWAKENGQH